jgi:hypothetical protein
VKGLLSSSLSLECGDKPREKGTSTKSGGEGRKNDGTTKAVVRNRGIEGPVLGNWQQGRRCRHLELVSCPEHDIRNGSYDERDWRHLFEWVAHRHQTVSP